MNIIYNLSISLYGIAVKLASNFNPKAKLFADGRKNWVKRMAEKIRENDRVIWMHCSSLGEFEQGRPLIEKIKSNYPNHKIAVSFFSPSGYEVRKNYSGADYIFYLPLDTPANAWKLIKALHPEILILVKYEYWYNLLNQLEKANIPVIVISAVIKENSLFLRSYAVWFREIIKRISHFFVQNEASEKLLNQIGVQNVSISGDTRFDRVKEILNTVEKVGFVEKFKGNHKLLIAGSSWPDDEEILAAYINQALPEDWKVIFAPHNIDEKQIQNLIGSIKGKSIRFTQMNENELESANVLIVDTVGILTKIYASATVSYVGGGFTKTGVHNTLEPAVYGVPLIFGPVYQNYFEAVDLINSTAAISYTDKNDFFLKMNELVQNEALRKQRGKIAYDYIQQKPDATGLIMNWVNQKIKK